MSTLTFSVPWSALCSKNAKFVGRTKKVLSPEYRAAMEAVGNAAFVAAKKKKWRQTTKRCRVVAVITEPDHRVRDAYNLGEGVLDGLSKCSRESIWHDDCQARDVRFAFQEDVVSKEAAGATITIEEL